MRLQRVVLALTASLICVIAVESQAQVTTATVYGIVQDQSAALVPGAAITLTHDATGAVRQTTSDRRGEFVFTSLPVGSYTLKVEKEGFKAYVRTGLELAAAQSVRQTHVLEGGAPAEIVTVEASAPLVNTVSAEQRESL